MIRNVIIQQKEERNALVNKAYISRVDKIAITEYLSSTLIKLITGPRRAGKSVLALQLLDGKIFAYLNFDDEMLLRHFEEDLIISVLLDVYGDFNYLLLDEIQNLPSWELWVSKLYRRGVNLIITGSNSKLLSREIASSLTGRFVQITVLPFSFAETIRYAGLSINIDCTPVEKGKNLGLFHTYLLNGGYPEVMQNQGLLKSYLSSLFDSILFKGIVKRFKIRQTQQLYDLSNYLLSNYTNLFSYNQIKESMGFNSVATVQKFIGYLEEPFLFQHLSKFSNKLKNHSKSAQKIYVIDNGFIQARSFELSPNFGRMLENLVFVELLRRGYRVDTDLFYYRTRNDREIDFLYRIGHQVKQLIQVCYDLSAPKTLKREVDALIEASQELNCENLLILTWDREDLIEHEKLKIHLLPVYVWLLDKEKEFIHESTNNTD